MALSPTADPAVGNDTGAGRYQITSDGQTAGAAYYRLRPPDIVVFTHTEVDEAFEGKGLAGQMVKAALDDVRAQGKKVRALCPYVARYIERHPEYGDLVVHGD